MGLSWSQDQLPFIGTWSWTVSEPHSKIEKVDGGCVTDIDFELGCSEWWQWIIFNSDAKDT